MKFLKNIFLFLFVFASATTLGQKFPPRPNPPRLVNDYINLLTDNDQKIELEKKLVAFDKQTSTQITVVITDDILGMDAGDYANALGEEWQVGNKGFNNGVVFLVYKNKAGSGNKVFIASGKGLEDVLPDYTCSEIVNNEVIPKLRGGDFYHAIDNGTTAIINATQGKYTAPKGYGKGKSPSLFTILLIIFIIVVVLGMINKGGGGTGSYMSRRGYRGYNGPSIWWTGGGGSGWGGGGSSGGGGFGGFGGGSFGGGGAGGDW
jgi:uncharacterized protein